MHGRECNMTITCPGSLFAGLSSPMTVARYHSLAATDLPDCLEVTTTAPDGEIMAVQHKEYEIYGVQFHPESVMTPNGLQLIRNFLEG